MTATCPLCTPTAEDVLWRDDFCRVILVDDADHAGFCRIILNAHVKEMSDLSGVGQQRLMAVVFALEALLRELLTPTLQPAKINLASLGNMVPHMHWHVIPRYADDAQFPDAIWAPARRAAVARMLPEDFRTRLVAGLVALPPALPSPAG